LNPTTFQKKWIGVELKGRSTAQGHFLNLCQILNFPTPADVDPDGSFYTFKRGASKLSGGKGWADVWYRGYSAEEFNEEERYVR
jgi:hypothetical protein